MTHLSHVTIGETNVNTFLRQSWFCSQDKETQGVVYMLSICLLRVCQYILVGDIA